MEWMVSAATRRGDRPTNQDQVLMVDGAAAVLDGATSWLPQDPNQDGGWYARMLASALARRLPGYGVPLADHLFDAIGEVRDRFSLDPDRSPYSTATLLRWDQESLDTLVLGDSPVVVQPHDAPPILLTDGRLEPIGADIRAAYRQHLLDGHGFDERFAGLVAEVQRVERRYRNRDGGFWVAGADPNAAHHVLQRSWPIGDVEAVLAMSDGVACGVLDYRILDWAGMFDQVRTVGVAGVTDAVHRAETTDPDGLRWPRTKRHDDKAVVALIRG